jgi:hypothetical protein
MKIPTKEENLAKVMAKPVIGYGTFVWGGERLRLPIVRIGKRDVTLRYDKDGTLITFKKKDLEKVEDP